MSVVSLTDTDTRTKQLASKVECEFTSVGAGLVSATSSSESPAKNRSPLQKKELPGSTDSTYTLTARAYPGLFYSLLSSGFAGFLVWTAQWDEYRPWIRDPSLQRACFGVQGSYLGSYLLTLLRHLFWRSHSRRCRLSRGARRKSSPTYEQSCKYILRCDLFSCVSSSMRSNYEPRERPQATP